MVEIRKSSAKAKSYFICQNCGYQSARWMGRCPDCGEWDTLAETVGDLQKKEELRSEKELAADANRIWDSKLAQSDLPDRIKGKIKKHVSHHKFVADDVLNVYRQSGSSLF